MAFKAGDGVVREGGREATIWRDNVALQINDLGGGGVLLLTSLASSDNPERDSPRQRNVTEQSKRRQRRLRLPIRRMTRQ